MRLVCPSCQAAYEVPDHRLGSGPRRLRCARCGQEWTVEPAPATAPPPPPPPPPRQRPVLPPLVAEERRPPPAPFPDYEEEPVGKRGAFAAWAASLLLLAGLAVAAVQFQAEIMRAWPPSQRLYALFPAGLR
jgi:predicted Zn finger-like uncharacterized protein